MFCYRFNQSNCCEHFFLLEINNYHSISCWLHPACMNYLFKSHYRVRVLTTPHLVIIENTVVCIFHVLINGGWGGGGGAGRETVLVIYQPSHFIVYLL